MKSFLLILIAGFLIFLIPVVLSISYRASETPQEISQETSQEIPQEQLGAREYNRSLFPLWIDEDHDCQDARQEVLIRDADGPLTYSPDHCKVLKGTWIDPYTNKVFTDPRGLDIDHVVPLKNAWISGANTWTREQRTKYANYLKDPMHLLAVSASENRKKGDKSPERYLPPNQDFQCEYIQEWVSIKRMWKLVASEKEEHFILETGCIN